MEQPALLEEAPSVKPMPVPTQAHYDLCPECGEALLAREEGCAKCYGCGHSEC
jgi:ribonucleoside-diphosphate reductase alpha chain